MDYKTVFQLAESKGYLPCDYFLNGNGFRSPEFESNEVQVMELALIQKWLRDEHSLHIYIDTSATFDTIQPSKWKAHIKQPFQPFRWTTGKYYVGDTYEEALLQGIYNALKLIADGKH